MLNHFGRIVTRILRMHSLCVPTRFGSRRKICGTVTPNRYKWLYLFLAVEVQKGKRCENLCQRYSPKLAGGYVTSENRTKLMKVAEIIGKTCREFQRGFRNADRSLEV